MTIQGELPIEEPEISEAAVKHTEADVVEALERRYGAFAGNGPRYATAYGVRSHAGFDARRTADFVAMDLWPSGGLRMHGHEVKVSRSDWLRELKDPSKAAEFIPYMNCWWLAVSDKRIVRAGELPDDWGLLALNGKDMTVVKAAPKRDAKPLTPTRLAALLRAVATTAEARTRRQAAEAGTTDGATPAELRAALTKARWDIAKVSGERERALEEARAWKVAFAAAGGTVACRHCGEVIVPSFRGGRFSAWRHREPSRNAVCKATRGSGWRWAEVGPRDDITDSV